MPNRAKRRRNREAREAPAREAAELEAFLDFADEKLLMRRVFVAEAVKSRGLIALTFRPRGNTNYLDVYGGEVKTDGTSRLHGDGIVNDWVLPSVRGYRVRFIEEAALVARLDPTFTSLDVSNVWLRTADELVQPPVSLAVEGDEQRIVVSREGLARLSQTIGNTAIAVSLQYIEGQLFPTEQQALPIGV